MFTMVLNDFINADLNRRYRQVGVSVSTNERPQSSRFQGDHGSKEDAYNKDVHHSGNETPQMILMKQKPFKLKGSIVVITVEPTGKASFVLAYK